jgi:ABC-type transporter MlaC component
MPTRALLRSLLVALSLATPGFAAAQDVPRERAEKLLASFRELKPGKGLAPAEQAANTRIVESLDAAFDFEGITASILAPRAEKLTPVERKRFKDEFHGLIRAGTFVDTSAFFKKATLTFKPSAPGAAGAVVAIHVAVPSDDTELDVGLVWRELAGTHKVVDVLVDGDSLVKDYQNQVARIVDRDGAAGLFAKLAERRAQIDRAQIK